jgi:hypothetical protein
MYMLSLFCTTECTEKAIIAVFHEDFPDHVDDWKRSRSFLQWRNAPRHAATRSGVLKRLTDTTYSFISGCTEVAAAKSEQVIAAEDSAVSCNSESSGSSASSGGSSTSVSFDVELAATASDLSTCSRARWASMRFRHTEAERECADSIVRLYRRHCGSSNSSSSLVCGKLVVPEGYAVDERPYELIEAALVRGAKLVLCCEKRWYCATLQVRFEQSGNVVVKLDQPSVTMGAFPVNLTADQYNTRLDRLQAGAWALLVQRA